MGPLSCMPPRSTPACRSAVTNVARLMKILRIEGVHRGWPTTVTTVRDLNAPRHPDLIKRAWATPTAPDLWWVADFTYVWTVIGFVYVLVS